MEVKNLAKQLQKNLNRKRLNLKKQGEMSTRWPPRLGRARVMALSSSRPHKENVHQAQALTAQGEAVF